MRFDEIVMPLWFVNGMFGVVLSAFVLLLLYVVMRIHGTELHHLSSFFVSEWKDFKNRDFTVGSFNMMALIVVTLFGLVVSVLSGVQKVIGVLAGFLEKGQIAELVHYTNYFSLFYCVFSLALVSLLAVMIDQMKRR